MSPSLSELGKSIMLDVNWIGGIVGTMGHNSSWNFIEVSHSNMLSCDCIMSYPFSMGKWVTGDGKVDMVKFK